MKFTLTLQIPPEKVLIQRQLVVFCLFLTSLLAFLFFSSFEGFQSQQSFTSPSSNSSIPLKIRVVGMALSIQINMRTCAWDICTF